jgi:hypothetical protein
MQEALTGQAVMSKRVVFVSILFAGMVVWLTILCLVKIPSNQNIEYVSNTTRGLLLLAFSILAGAISAASAVARVPGRWGAKFDQRAKPIRFKRQWIWPLFMVVLSVANFLMALAVFAGNALVTSKKASDGL